MGQWAEVSTCFLTYVYQLTRELDFQSCFLEHTEKYKQEVDHSMFIIEKIGNTIKIQYGGLVKS